MSKSTKICLALFVLVFSVMVFDLAFYSEPHSVSSRLGKVAGVATMSAAVAPNPINTEAAQLDAKEKALQQKEVQLNERQAKLDSAYKWQDEKVLIYLFLVALGLIYLTVINFYLDFRKNKRTFKIAHQN